MGVEEQHLNLQRRSRPKDREWNTLKGVQWIRRKFVSIKEGQYSWFMLRTFPKKRGVESSVGKRFINSGKGGVSHVDRTVVLVAWKPPLRIKREERKGARQVAVVVGGLFNVALNKKIMKD